MAVIARTTGPSPGPPACVIAIGVTYAAFYDYLNCLSISPCAAWMNSNATYRDGASERAAELNQQYLDIIAEYTYIAPATYINN
jgi:hypothetical protein